MARLGNAVIAGVFGFVLASAPAGAAGSGEARSPWHPWFEIGGYYNSRLSTHRIFKLVVGGRC